MSVFEQLSIIIQIAGIIAVVVTLLYASRQIKTSKNIHKETLDWNRKTTTNNELNNRQDKELRLFLMKQFQPYVEKGITVIPISEIENAIKSDLNVQLQIHSYLNKYERISRGINNGLYDKAMVVETMKYIIVKVYFNYRDYIKYRRKIANKNAWKNFENLAIELNNEHKIYLTDEKENK